MHENSCLNRATFDGVRKMLHGQLLSDTRGSAGANLNEPPRTTTISPQFSGDLFSWVQGVFPPALTRGKSNGGIKGKGQRVRSSILCDENLFILDLITAIYSVFVFWVWVYNYLAANNPLLPPQRMLFFTRRLSICMTVSIPQKILPQTYLWTRKLIKFSAASMSPFFPEKN